MSVPSEVPSLIEAFETEPQLYDIVNDNVVNSHKYLFVDVGGTQVALITDAVIVSWICMAAILIVVLIGTRKMGAVPRNPLQNLLETFVSFMNSYFKDTMGGHHKAYVPYLGTVGLFLLFVNLVSLFNILPTGEFLYKITGIEALYHFGFEIHTPSKNLNVALALTIMTWFIMVGTEFRYRGFRGWLRSWYKPYALNLFIKPMDYVTRPLTLTFRLFGVMFAGTMLLTLSYVAFPIGLPLVVHLFEMFMGVLQAGVFVLLTAIYSHEGMERV